MMTAKVIDFNEPLDGKAIAAGALKNPACEVPITLWFESQMVVGFADVGTDGIAQIRLHKTYESWGDTSIFCLGYRAMSSHINGDVLVADDIEVVTVGIFPPPLRDEE